MLSNAYFLAKFGFDTAENEPSKNLQNFVKFSKKLLPRIYSAARSRGERAAGRLRLRAQLLAKRGHTGPALRCRPGRDRAVTGCN